MKPLIFIVFIITCLTSCGQTTKTFYLKDIGWTIKLPSDFKVEDSAVILKDTKEGTIILEKESQLKLNMASTKNLISASKDMFNQF